MNRLECDGYNLFTEPEKKSEAGWPRWGYSIGCYATGNDDMEGVIKALVDQINYLRDEVDSLRSAHAAHVMYHD